MCVPSHKINKIIYIKNSNDQESHVYSISDLSRKLDEEAIVDIVIEHLNRKHLKEGVVLTGERWREVYPTPPYTNSLSQPAFVEILYDDIYVGLLFLFPSPCPVT